MDLREAIQRRLPPRLPVALREMGTIASVRGERLYLVGGAVRDLLLGRPIPIREVDLVLVGDVARLVREAAAAGLARPLARSEFLTFKLEVAGHPGVDLVTARRETYAHPGALPQVEPATLEEDLRRRDFTINAMAASLGPGDFGEVADPYDGLADLRAQLVRVLHSRSFQDDATRVLRAARYTTRFGFKLARETESWARQDARYLETISADRLRHELDRIWQEPAPEAVLSMLRALGALPHLHPSLRWDDSLAQVFARARSEKPADLSLSLVYLALLGLRTASSEAGSFISRLNLPPAQSRALRDAAALALDAEKVAPGLLPPSKVVEALDPYDIAAVFAEALDHPEHRDGPLLHYIREWRHVRPALNGEALLSLGVPQGPLVGDYLTRLRDARLDGEVKTEAEERALVKQWLREVT